MSIKDLHTSNAYLYTYIISTTTVYIIYTYTSSGIVIIYNIKVRGN